MDLNLGPRMPARPFVPPSAPALCSSLCGPRHPSLPETYPGSIRQQVSIRSFWGTQAERGQLQPRGPPGPYGVSVECGHAMSGSRGKRHWTSCSQFLMKEAWIPAHVLPFGISRAVRPARPATWTESRDRSSAIPLRRLACAAGLPQGQGSLSSSLVVPR